MAEKGALVLGFGGKTGQALIDYFLKRNYKVIANDSKKEETLNSIIKKYKREKNITFITGKNLKTIPQNIEIVGISPGVPSNLDVICEAKKRNIPVLSEIEIAYREYPYNWIGITGTNGKSTTTALVGEIFKFSEKKFIVGGNIGNPLLPDVIKLKSNSYFIIAELSSFQLENIYQFKPFIGIILNLEADHLDRYNSLDEYFSAKFNLFKNQTENEYSIFNSDCGFSMKYKEKFKIKSRQYYFGLNNPYRGAFLKKDYFCWRNDNKVEYIIKNGDQKIKGLHNIYNILSAITITKIAGIDSEAIKKGIVNFKGLEHRMEIVEIINGRIFINDSKATTTSAVKMSLAGIDGKVILIMGGKDKGLDFTELNEILNKKVKYLILIGEAKEKIKNSIDYPENKIFLTDDFEESINKAYSVSREGDTIILSPACASFDMFENFEHRGKVFKEIVKKLKKKYGK